MSTYNTLGAVKEAATTAGVTFLMTAILIWPLEATAWETKARAAHLLEAPEINNHIYRLGENRGNVIIIGDCAYRVLTRTKLPAKEFKGQVEAVPGSIGKYEEADGTHVCSTQFQARSAHIVEQGANLYHVEGHPLVIVKEVDGGLTLFPWLYDIDTKKWKVKDFAFGFTLQKIPKEIELSKK